MAISIIGFTFFSDDMVAGLSGQCAGNPDGRCEFNPTGALDKDPTPPNPNRPYFDACGSEYDYLGNLISQGTGCQATVQPAAQPSPSVTTQPKTTDFEGKQ